jgi:hypothetical protein
MSIIQLYMSIYSVSTCEHCEHGLFFSPFICVLYEYIVYIFDFFNIQLQAHLPTLACFWGGSRPYVSRYQFRCVCVCV